MRGYIFVVSLHYHYYFMKNSEEPTFDKLPCDIERFPAGDAAFVLR
jgi:hypothetical protein